MAPQRIETESSHLIFENRLVRIRIVSHPSASKRFQGRVGGMRASYTYKEHKRSVSTINPPWAIYETPSTSIDMGRWWRPRANMGQGARPIGASSMRGLIGRPATTGLPHLVHRVAANHVKTILNGIRFLVGLYGPIWAHMATAITWARMGPNRMANCAMTLRL